MTLVDDLAAAPIHALAPLIAKREVSAREVLNACAARIERGNGHLGAIAESWLEDAAHTARWQDEAIAHGTRLGPLHGIPLGLKDNLMVAGRIAAVGSLALAERVSERTATVAERLQRAGGILAGRMQMVEFAAGAWGTNRRLGTPRNPWDKARHRVPGGSSSGSGVAVAAGFLPAALGTDTGGSIRVPAAFNGIVGLKPTYGAVSNFGVVPAAQSLDTVGPLCRSVEDAAVLHAAISGSDPRDPATIHVPWRDPLARLKKPVKGLRVGLVGDAQLAGMSPDMRTALQAAAGVFAELGASVEDIRLPRSPAEYSRTAATLIRAECHSNFAALVDGPGDALDPVIRARLRKGGQTSAHELLTAISLQKADRLEINEFLSDFDAVLLPTTPAAAIPLENVDEDDGSVVDYTRMANLLGLCSLSLPCGFDAEGMPLSLQIVGRPFDEARILQLGWAYEQATPWHERMPDW